MGRQINLYEAKTQLSRLVDDAAKGETIVIAKDGKPMATTVLSFERIFVAADAGVAVLPGVRVNRQTPKVFRSIYGIKPIVLPRISARNPRSTG